MFAVGMVVGIVVTLATVWWLDRSDEKMRSDGWIRDVDEGRGRRNDRA